MQRISTASLPIDAQERPNLEGLNRLRIADPIALGNRSKSASRPPGDALRGHVLCWLLGLAKAHLCQAR